MLVAQVAHNNEQTNRQAVLMTMSDSPQNDAQQQAVSAAPATDWRKSVAQSFRSNQVKEVAEALASLEPGATSRSKLMLAMRFENSIFDKAESLDDYRKTIIKRLKKLKKNYKPGEESAEVQARKATQREAQLEIELRQKHGAALKYIVQNSEKAVDTMKEKHGDSRATHLKQHLDSAEQWAVEIGVIEEGAGPGKRRKRVPRELGYLEKLSEMFLEKRVDNIRSHVVKLVEPDLFLGESLVKIEAEMLEGQVGDKLCWATRGALANAGLSYPRDVETMKKLLELLTTPVPAPRQGRQQDIKDASLAYIDRIRTCSQALIGFMAMDPNDRAQLKGILRKIHNVAVEGMEHLEKFYVAPEASRKEALLEDAWTKVMEFHSTYEGGIEPPDVDAAQPAKRVKVSRLPLRTKVLLTPGRKTPSNLLPALESKKAKLIRPDGVGVGARLTMSFGKAFYMSVYFQPLLVLIRAIPDDSVEYDGVSDFRRIIVDGCLPTWTSAGYGIPSSDLSVGGVSGSSAVIGSLVEDKLESASARATSVLRRVFADVAGRSYETAKTDFEIEITEATALLRFLQIARDTYVIGDNDT